jgi:hypothetical protein
MESWIERNKKGWKARQFERQTDEYFRILTYMLFPERWTHDLIYAALQAIQGLGRIVAGLGMITLSVVASIPETIRDPHHQLHGSDRVILLILVILGGVLNSWGSYELAKPWFSVFKVRTRIAAFPSYVKTIPKATRKVNLEETAISTRLHGRPMWEVPPDK